MPPLRAVALPPSALLAKYAARGAYTDCYAVDLSRFVTHARYVETFYTGRLFKVERWLLRVFLSAGSTDADARELAAGARDTFAAWRVEARATDQLLMCDISGRTRSWLMTAPVEGSAGTRLYFGSAVVPVVDPVTGVSRLGRPFELLLGFHAVYSRALLASARARLARTRD